MRLILRVLRGIDIPPQVVALARGFVEAVVLGALAAGAAYITADERLLYIAPVGLIIIRWLEGVADHIDPLKRRQP